MAQRKIERVAIISYHSPPFLNGLGLDPRNSTIGGMSADVAQLAIGLDALGIEVTVLTSNQVSARETLEQVVGNNIHLVQIPTDQTGEPTYDKNELRLRARNEYFTGGVLEYYGGRPRPQIIKSDYWLSFRAAEALREKYNVPVVHKFHTEERIKARFPENEVDWSRVEEEDRIAKAADGIVVSTPSCLADLVSWGVDREKIYVVPPGFNPEIFYPRDKTLARRELELPEDKHILLAAGRHDSSKNYDLLIRAFQMMNHSNSMLYIIGGTSSDKERQDLERLSLELGIADYVKLVDWVNPESLSIWYSAAAALVVPSKHETFGMVALEAMACGVPVIASNIGGLPYLVMDGVTGLLVKPNDKSALAVQMQGILSTDSSRNDMGIKARSHAQNYQLGLTTSRMLEVYQKVLFSYANIPGTAKTMPAA